MNPQIAMIVISYRKPELIERLLRSARSLMDRENVLILIVDNDSTTESRNALAPLAADSVQILFQDRNLGYFGGAQAGLEWLNERNLKPNWVIVSNSDIEFPQADLWRRLAAYEINPRTGVLAPGISSGLSLSDQNPFFVARPKASRMHFYKWIFRWYWTGVAYGYLGFFKDSLRGIFKKKNRNEIGERRTIYAPHGAFMIFHRNYFNKGCDFKHGAFLFNEEFTVAENCRAYGLDVVYEPSLVVEHEDHATMGGRPNRMIQRYHGEASRFTADRYFS